MSRTRYLRGITKAKSGTGMGGMEDPLSSLDAGLMLKSRSVKFEQVEAVAVEEEGRAEVGVAVHGVAVGV